MLGMFDRQMDPLAIFHRELDPLGLFDVDEITTQGVKAFYCLTIKAGELKLWDTQPGASPPANLDANPNQFELWTEGNITPTANTDTAPDSTPSADSVNLTSSLEASLTFLGLTIGQTYTFGLSVQSPTATSMVLRVYDTNTFGIVSTTSPAVSSSFGRVSVTFTASVANMQIALSGQDGTSRKYVLWGGYLHVGSVAQAYPPVSAPGSARVILSGGVLTAAASAGKSIVWDPVTQQLREAVAGEIVYTP